MLWNSIRMTRIPSLSFAQVTLGVRTFWTVVLASFLLDISGRNPTQADLSRKEEYEPSKLRTRGIVKVYWMQKVRWCHQDQILLCHWPLSSPSLGWLHHYQGWRCSLTAPAFFSLNSLSVKWWIDAHHSEPSLLSWNVSSSGARLTGVPTVSGGGDVGCTGTIRTEGLSSPREGL